MAEIAVNTTKLEHVLTKALAEEWESQGHKMTGSITDTIEYVVKQETDRLTISGMMYFYGNIIAAGVKSGRIPYSGRTGRGGTSLYIKALQEYVKARMYITDEQKSLSIAFAIATEQKKQGMPTSGSYRFSYTGKRTDWVEEAFKNNEELIVETVREMCFELLSVKFDVLLKVWQTELNKN